MSKKNEWPLIEDLIVFQSVVKKNSFSKAANDLGVSKAYVTKRISILEARLKIKLFYRDTRNIKLTLDGERAFNDTYHIIAQIKNFMSNTAAEKHDISGTFHLSTSLGFGRAKLAKAISVFKNSYPQLDIKLTLTDQEIDLIKEDIDLHLHIGQSIKNSYYAKKITANRRVLCAAPSYVDTHGKPASIEALAEHNCLFIQEHNSHFGAWTLSNHSEVKTIKVSGDLSSNSGEIILDWAIDGHGIVLRSLWDAQQHLTDGTLIHLLPDWDQAADLWAVYPQKLSESYKTQVMVDFLTQFFKQHPL